MKNDTAVPVFILIALIVIALIGPKNTSKTAASPSGPSKSAGSDAANVVIPSSPQASSIGLGTGNASYTYQPYDEYINVYNKGREPVDITGWQLKNGKSERAYDMGGTLKQFPADFATIGQAALFISPQGFNILQDVVLKPGETAIITTGQVGSQLPYKIVSFKENICSGYLEDLLEYKFTPHLTRNCPRPANEPGIAYLDTECRKFVERMGACHTPKFETRDKDREICYNCVDGKSLSGSCIAFIKNHFNYGSCIAYHQGDANFSGRTWRVFFGKGWEMWAQKYETITLFDRLGQLVSERSY